MEEILASIRRIISEDDAPAAEAKEAAPAPPPAPEPVVAPPEPPPVATIEEDDDLELTDKVESHGDLDVYSAPPPPEPAPAPAPAPVFRAPEPAPVASPSIESLVSERATTAAASSFGQLSAALAMPAEGRSLEDLIREMLRPMLQQWLDANLPSITQAAVEAEVARISRTRVR